MGNPGGTIGCPPLIGPKEEVHKEEYFPKKAPKKLKEIKPFT